MLYFSIFRDRSPKEGHPVYENIRINLKVSFQINLHISHTRIQNVTCKKGLVIFLNLQFLQTTWWADQQPFTYKL